MTAGRTVTRDDRQRAKREPASKKPKLSPDLRILQTQVFRGPNYWSYEPCIRLLVDLGSLEHWPSNTIPGFSAALLGLLPGVGEHSCSLGKRMEPGWDMWPSTWRWSFSESPAPTSPAARHGGRAPPGNTT